MENKNLSYFWAGFIGGLIGSFITLILQNV